MHNERLKGKRIAVLATNGYEQSELDEPVQAIREAGGQAVVVSPESGRLRAWSGGDWGGSVDVDQSLDDARAEDFDGLVLPGGVLNPDQLRRDSRAVGFAHRFFELGRPVAAICHAPWLLVEADVVRDRRMTSYGSVRTDLVNAGARWVDEEVVVDGGLVTSRSPDDLAAFCSKMVEEFAEGEHAAQRP